MSRIKFTTETMSPRFSETVLGELDTRFSRTQAEMAPTEGDLPFGLALMKNTDGSYSPLSATAAPAAEGEEQQAPKPNGEACAILLSSVSASKEKQTALILRGFAILNSANIMFDKSVTDKKTAFSQLEKHNFIIENIPEAQNGFIE